MFFGKGREDKVILLMRKHLVAIDEALALWSEFMFAYCEDAPDSQLKDMSYKVHLKEHEADLVKREIQKQLIEGAFLPFYRENFLKMPEMIDKFPGLAVKICKEVFLQNVKMPNDLRDYMRKLVQGVIETYKQFLEIFDYLPKDLSKVIQLTEKVSLCEQHLDTIEWKAKVYLFKHPNNLERIDRLFFRDLITLVSDIADKIENAADYIELTMIKMQV